MVASEFLAIKCPTRRSKSHFLKNPSELEAKKSVVLVE